MKRLLLVVLAGIAILSTLVFTSCASTSTCSSYSNTQHVSTGYNPIKPRKF